MYVYVRTYARASVCRAGQYARAGVRAEGHIIRGYSAIVEEDARCDVELKLYASFGDVGRGGSVWLWY